MKKIFIITLFVLAGCFQAYNPDDDFRSVPVTNNPNVIPNHGGALSGFGGGSQQGPY